MKWLTGVLAALLAGASPVSAFGAGAARAEKSIQLRHFEAKTWMGDVRVSLLEAGLSRRAVTSLKSVQPGDAGKMGGERAILLYNQDQELVLPASILTDGKVHFGLRLAFRDSMDAERPALIVARTDHSGRVIIPDDICGRFTGFFSLYDALQRIADARAGKPQKTGLGWPGDADASLKSFHQRLAGIFDKAYGPALK